MINKVKNIKILYKKYKKYLMIAITINKKKKLIVKL